MNMGWKSLGKQIFVHQRFKFAYPVFMKRKPWAIIILSALHILAPVGNLLMNSYRSSRTLIATWNYWTLILPKSLFIAYVILPPVAGVMIYICRRWSYWGYLFCLLWIFAANMYGFWTDMSVVNFTALAGILLLDFLAVAYFVVPSVRTVYFDPKARWWETAPRFTFHLEASLNEHRGLICNVSVGGLFVEAWDGFQQDQEIAAQWTYENKTFRIPARIVYKNPRGYGLRFHHTSETLRQIKEFIRLLESRGVPVANRQIVASDDFFPWIKNLFTKGEGLFPKR
jgi:hypothetical protein